MGVGAACACSWLLVFSPPQLPVYPHNCPFTPSSVCFTPKYAIPSLSVTGIAPAMHCRLYHKDRYPRQRALLAGAPPG